MGLDGGGIVQGDVRDPEFPKGAQPSTRPAADIDDGPDIAYQIQNDRHDARRSDFSAMHLIRVLVSASGHDKTV